MTGLRPANGGQEVVCATLGKGERGAPRWTSHGKNSQAETLVLILDGLVRLTSDAGGGLKEKYNQAIKYED